MRINKKAQISHTVLKSILWFFFLIVVLLSIVFLVRGYITVVIDTKDIEADLFYNEVLFTKGGISYYDTIIDRVYPGIIDINKFNDDVFSKSISYGSTNYFISANLSLISPDGKEIGSFIYNEEWYKKWKPLTKRYLPGPGSATKIQKQSYVLVRQKEGIIPAILYAEIIYPNK